MMYVSTLSFNIYLFFKPVVLRDCWLIFMFLFHLQRLYKKSATDGFADFSLIVDRPELVLARINAANLSDVCLKKKKKQLPL